MPAGGARANSGPGGDPHSLRAASRDAGSWTHLPAEGRLGPTPRWPLPTPPSSLARKLWREHWRLPQALMWERDRQQVQVGLCVLAMLAAEGPKASASDRTAAQSLMTDLGLTRGGMRLNRWIIDGDPIGVAVPPAAPAKTSGPSAKERLKGRGLGVIDGGG